MQFIIEVLTSILMAYLAFTNYLAGLVEPLFTPSEEPAEITKVTPVVSKNESETDLALTPLPFFSTIPDILKDNARYQAATAVGAVTARPSNNPAAAIVNIYCTFTNNRTIRTTTGTGFFVHESGVILTNAHVAQFLLLSETDVLGESRCVVRSGSPASPLYTASLLYLPPAWIAEHAALIDASAPSGTGERDYALLHVTGRVDSAPLPARFPFLALRSGSLTERAIAGPLSLYGYPVSESVDTATDLTLATATTSVTGLFTFGDNAVDVLGLRGTAVGAQGASGGPVLNNAGEVIALITTRGNDTTDGRGSLRAITVDHIERTIAEEASPLRNQLSGDIGERALLFQTTIAPFLRDELAAEVGE